MDQLIKVNLDAMTEEELFKHAGKFIRLKREITELAKKYCEENNKNGVCKELYCIKKEAKAGWVGGWGGAPQTCMPKPLDRLVTGYGLEAYRMKMGEKIDDIIKEHLM